MTDPTQGQPPSIEAFSFGDPEPVMSMRDIFFEGAYLLHDEWWEPPIPWAVLSKSYRATAHHGSALQVKRNILNSTYKGHPMLPRKEFNGLVMDFLILGNGYLEEVRGRLGRRLGFRRLMGKHVRRGAKPDQYWWVPDWQQRAELPAGRVCHIMQPDIDQEIYGIPDYLGAMQSVWLNENATLFRRRYYLNGSHAGFILYVSDPQQNQDDIDAIRKALKDSKGPGNFRNLFLYSPNGKKDGVQVIPVSEVAAKDEFWKIKETTRDDQLAAHRVPPQLMGVVPQNSAGFGDVAKAAQVFVANELHCLQASLQELNEWAGEEIISFRPYRLDDLHPDPGLDPTL
jgi:PBSX family phage portal protein